MRKRPKYLKTGKKLNGDKPLIQKSSFTKKNLFLFPDNPDLSNFAWPLGLENMGRPSGKICPPWAGIFWVNLYSFCILLFFSFRQFCRRTASITCRASHKFNGK